MKTIKDFLAIFLLLSLVFLSRAIEEAASDTSSRIGDSTAATTGDTTPTTTDTPASTTTTTIATTPSTTIEDVVKIHEPRSAPVDEKPSKKQAKKQESYAYTIRALHPKKSAGFRSGSSKKTPAIKNFNGLLINRNVVATVRVPNSDDARLCYKSQCHKANKIKDTKDFTYWRLEDRRRGPFTFAGYIYKSMRCNLNSAHRPVVLRGNNNKLICDPACKNGDVLICNDTAAGIIKGKDDLSLVTVRELVNEGGFKRQTPVFRAGKKRRPRKHLKKWYNVAE